MTRHTLHEQASTGPEPVAVIGMGCRLSGEASSIEGFWDMLSCGRRGHKRVPASRYEASAWHHPSTERRGAINNDSGFFLEEDPSRFDAPFFSITAKEAAGMDPVQRLLLEVAYEAFENGGVPMESLPGSSTGVYSGCMTNDYELLSTRDTYDMPHNSASGNGRTMLANRLSWFFDLRGPSIMMDTACSSSLTALHLAVEALQTGECNMTLVTGASLILHPNFTQRLSYMHMVSPDGISHSFDSKANGYGRGEGFGAVLLKPLAKALADGDAIRAVIRATGCNQDGRTPGITMPNASAQADLIRSTYRKAKLSMHETAYFEAHGTGTEIGDPTELGAIGQSFGAQRLPGSEPLYVGSVKSNIGHTEGAAGVAGVIKVILCLEKGMLVPNAGFSQVNPRIRLDEWGLQLSNTTMPWPDHLPQRASINSFGFGGSNAHAVIESAAQYLGAPIQPVMLDAKCPQIVVFSTHDKAGIERTAKKWESYINTYALGKQDITMPSIAYTMCTRKSQLAFRSYAVADSTEQLQTILAGGLPSFSRASRKNQVSLGFIYTGQGAQWAQMGVELLAVPVFAESLERSQQILQSLGCPWNLIDEMQADVATSCINDPDRSQPICCALQIGLANLLTSWGVYPKAVVGHSSGEVGAAYAAGFLSHEDAIRVTYFRGVYSQRISQSGRRGGMMAASISATKAEEYIAEVPSGSVVVACINSPTSVTLSGDVDQIDELERRLQADGHFARKLKVSTAYHSPHMEALAKDYEESISSIKPQNEHNDKIAMFSSVTEERVYSNDLGTAYWVRNLVNPVKFVTAVNKMVAMTEAVKGRRRAVPVKWGGFLEIGPHHALKGPFAQTLQEVNTDLISVPYSSVLVRKQNALHTALQSAGALWCTGYDIDINVVNKSLLNEEPQQMISNLPSYAWNHQSTFWHEPFESARLRQRKVPRHDLLGVPLDYQNDLEPRWRNFLRVSEMPWIADHIVAGSIIYPAAGMVAMVAEAARQLADEKYRLKSIELQDLEIFRGMVIPEDERGLETLLHVKPRHGLSGWYEFGIFSLAEGSSWMQHAKGAFTLHYDTEEEVFSHAEWDYTVERVRQTVRGATKFEPEAVYEWLTQTGGITFGPTFKSTLAAYFQPNSRRLCVSGSVSNTKEGMPHQCESPSLIHPTSLDMLFQAAVLSCSDALSNMEANIPVGVERILLMTDFSLQAGDEFSIHAESHWENGESLSESIASNSSWQQPGVVLQGVRLGRVPISLKTSGASGELEQSRYSSLVWTEHLNSCSSLDVAGNSPSILREWMERACQNTGDGRTLAVATHDRADELIEALQGVSPKANSRPRLQELNVVLIGSTDTETSEKLNKRVEEALPGCQLTSAISVSDIDLATLGTSPFDYVLLDIQEVSTEKSMRNLLGALLPVSAEDAYIAFNSPSNGQKTAIKSTAALAGWELQKGSEDSDLLLVQRQAPRVELDRMIYALFRDANEIPQPLLHELEQVFAEVGIQVSPVGIHKAADLKDKTVISFLEYERPWVAEWNSDTMEQFRAVMHAKYVLWVLRSSEDVFTDAGSGATTGLLRTLRNELSNVAITQLRFDDEAKKNHPSLARSIMQVINLTSQPTSRPPDREFLLKGNRLFIQRVVAEDTVDEAMNTLLHGPRPVSANLASDPRPLRLRAEKQDLTQAYWELDDRLIEELAPDEVDVELHMVSFSEKSSKTRLDPEARISAVEAMGRLHKVGSAVGKDMAVGDSVVLAISGNALPRGLATRVRMPSSAITKCPSTLDPMQAVSMPVAYTAAYFSLFGSTQILSAHYPLSVLIVGSASQTLRALIECALAAGLQTYIAVDNQNTVKSLHSEYPHLKEQILVCHKDLDSTVSRLTSGKSVDIVACSLGGTVGRLAARCLASGGRFVDLSEDLDPAALPRSFVERGCTFTSLRLSRMLRETPGQFKVTFQYALDLLVRNGKLSNVKNHAVFPVSRTPDAFAQAGSTGTRVILDLQAPGGVSIVPALPDPVALSGEHAYLLVGGLGTLGIALAKTLVECGARNLIFVSRSGAVQKDQQAALAVLAERGAQTNVERCDVTSEQDLRHLLTRAHEQDWKIRGVFQCATVLRDAMFEKMTFDEWKISTESKIQGTRNLHNLLLGTPLDFFVTFSSIASINGNIGQANYSAANGYMDALMVWRRNHNLPGNSINIGLVTDSSGISDIAETPEQRQQRYAHLKYVEINTHELQTLIKLIVQRTVSISPQIIAGLVDTLPRDGTANWPFDRKFDHRIEVSSEDQSAALVKTNLLLKQADTINEAVKIVNEVLQDYLAKAMTASADSIDMELPLSALGVDSLKATEVQNWVSREMGAELSSFEFLGAQSAKNLAEKIATTSSFVTVAA